MTTDSLRRVAIEAFKFCHRKQNLENETAEKLYSDCVDAAISELGLLNHRISKDEETLFAARISALATQKFDERVLRLDHPLLYVTRVILGKESTSRVNIAFVQTDFHSLGYYDLVDSFYIFKPEIVDQVYAIYKKKIEALSKKGANIICFPELTCPVDKLALVQELANRNDVYVIAGSYHNQSMKSNVCVLVTPGKLVEQVKFMKSENEGIEPLNKAILKIFESPFGRFVILICLDAEHPQLPQILEQRKLLGDGIDVIFNPASHPSPERAKNTLQSLASKAYAACVFSNNGPKDGSFIWNMTATSLKNQSDADLSLVDVSALRTLRGKFDYVNPI